jgi:hypothetical protein
VFSLQVLVAGIITVFSILPRIYRSKEAIILGQAVEMTVSTQSIKISIFVQHKIPLIWVVEEESEILKRCPIPKGKYFLYLRATLKVLLIDSLGDPICLPL